MPAAVAPLTAVAGAIALLLAAWQAWPMPHMTVAAVVAGFIAWLSRRQGHAMATAHASPGDIAAVHLHHAGLLLAWVAAVVALTYTIVLAWSEWWQFALAFALLAGLTLLLARTLRRDAALGPDDAAMLIIARFLAWLLLIGGTGAAIGLVADKKMTRFLDPRYTDWAANNVFFFGGIALAFLGLTALRTTRRPQS